MKCRALALLALSVPAVMHGQKIDRDTTGAESAKVAVDTAALQAGVQRVRAMLKDPDGAQFRGVTTGYDEKRREPAVCGFVNGRNGFGGYVGFVPFYSTASATEFDTPRSSFLFRRTFNRICPGLLR